MSEPAHAETLIRSVHQERYDDASSFTISLVEDDPLRFRLSYDGTLLFEEDFPLAGVGFSDGFGWLVGLIDHHLAQEWFQHIHTRPSREMLQEWYDRVEPYAYEHFESHASATVAAVEEKPDFSRGRTASEIRNAPLPETPWLVEGWLAPGQLVKLAAREKSGKSTLLYYLLAKLERGEPFLGIETVQTTALVVTKEPEYAVREKLDLFGIERARIVYTYEWADSSWAERVKRMVAVAAEEDGGHGLVVIDTIRGAAEIEDENDVEFGNAVKLATQASHASGRAFILTHHHRKSGGAVWDASSGHTSGAGMTDQNIEMFRLSDSVNDRRRKLASLGRPRVSTWELAVEWSEDGTSYEVIEAGSEEEDRAAAQQTADMWVLMNELGGRATAEEFARAAFHDEVEEDGTVPRATTLKKARRRLKRLVDQRIATVDKSELPYTYVYSGVEPLPSADGAGAA